MGAEQTRGVRAGMLRAQSLHRMVQSDLEGKLPELGPPPPPLSHLTPQHLLGRGGSKT